MGTCVPLHSVRVGGFPLANWKEAVDVRLPFWMVLPEMLGSEADRLLRFDPVVLHCR